MTTREQTYGSSLAEASEQHQHQSTASPVSTSVSSIPTAYQIAMTTAAMSPGLLTGSAGLDISGSAAGGVVGHPATSLPPLQHSLSTTQQASPHHGGDLRRQQTTQTSLFNPPGPSSTHMSSWQNFHSLYPAHRSAWAMGYGTDGGSGGATSAGMASPGAAQQPSATMPSYHGYRNSEDNDRQDVGPTAADHRYVQQTTTRP
jgi:hypothetical protein